MHGMNSETVDLIATDPPFNKGKDFHATPDSLASGASFQDRWSWDDDLEQDWIDQIEDDWPNVAEVVYSACNSWGKDMGAFLCFMGVRLIAMRRLLKPTGSIYLHCDPTASHYLKLLMDAIFGRKNFCSDITWKRYAAHSLSDSAVDTISDHLLYYAKDKRHIQATTVTQSLPEDELLERFPHIEEETGRRFQHVALEQSSNASSAGEIRSIQGQEVDSKIGWRWSQSTFDERLKENPHVIYWTKSGRPRYKNYLDEYKGRPVGNIWTDIPYLSSGDKERYGYPTQKPLSLYERIIKASSSKGDLVLDPFCGCATTCVAAERLDRQWVGIDIWDKAQDAVVDRMESEGLKAPKYTKRTRKMQSQFLFAEEFTFTDKIPTRTDDGHTDVQHLKVKSKIKPQEVSDGLSNKERKEKLIEGKGTVCQGCGGRFDDPRYLELDHNMPRADGGSNNLTNRILLCGPCNRLKSNLFTLSGLIQKNKELGYMKNVNLVESLR